MPSVGISAPNDENTKTVRARPIASMAKSRSSIRAARPRRSSGESRSRTARIRTRTAAFCSRSVGPDTAREGATGRMVSLGDSGPARPRPPARFTEQGDQSRDHVGADDERIDQDAGGEGEGELPERDQGHDGQHGEAQGQRKTGDRYGSCRPGRPQGDGIAQPPPPGLVPDPPDDEDVVVRPQGPEQDHPGEWY